MESKSDIRYRDWLELDSDLSKAVQFIINAENHLSEIDIIGVKNEFKSEFAIPMETFYNRLAFLRLELTDYIDNNSEIFDYIKNSK